MRIKPSQKSYQRRRIGGGEDKKFPVGMGREKMKRTLCHQDHEEKWPKKESKFY